MDIAFLKLLGIVILTAPLGGALVCGALGPRRLKDRTHWASIFGVGAAAAAALALLTQVVGAVRTSQTSGHEAGGSHVSATIPVYDWIATGARPSASPPVAAPIKGLPREDARLPHAPMELSSPSWFRVEFLVDPLSAIMLATVTCIALLIVIYSRDYMRHHDHAERGYERFFAYLALFVFSMCALVLGGNFLLLYLGWEAVGLCSYLLIGFYYGKPSAAAAAKKAFLVNRVGDFGFGLGILLIYITFGTLSYHDVFDMIARNVDVTGAALDPSKLTTLALLLFCGAAGKSAQIPLYVWLPDAMEGPSPVSALIHAATMVTAGVYMIARCGAIFVHSETAMLVVAVIGGCTAIFSATIALVQTDMKRILAYSTISQLGYMFLALGVYAADSAVFHLFTHAFFKALLFLGAGSVMHAMGGVIDLRQFSGLRHALPKTCKLILIGSLALAGVPLFSGFFSKDEILHHALSVHPALGIMGLVTAALTAFYTFRMFFMAFAGPLRVPEGVHPHESGSWMILPMSLLAIGAIFAGYLGVGFVGRPFHAFLEPVFHNTFLASTLHGAHEVVAAAPAGHAGAAISTGAAAGFMAEYGLLLASGGLAILSILAAYVVYGKNPWIAATVRATAPRVYGLLWNKYYVDEAYDLALVRPLRALGRLCFWLDEYIVDGLVWLIAFVPQAMGYGARGVQRGALQGYGLAMGVGLAIVVTVVLTW
ncbi:MAG: NADH-quinone oxidoreductase subunit L [Phycisphaerales bacterium]|nr:NADH-quinone oxidoreductase subunit L [Phycisphaerales bacterium]